MWVGCDGGVFASSESGRVETFSARNTGLVTTEPGFLAVHPVSSQLVAAGLQDNGTVVRVGDTVWEEVHLGDGGGVLFHPGHPEVMLDQYVSASWRCDHPRYRDPMQRRARRPGVLENDTEDRRSAFYSGAAAVAGGPHTGRVAIGTYRVWVCDDLTDAATPTWRVLPFTTGTAWRDRRARPSAGADAVMVVAGDRWGQPFDGTPRVYAGSVESLRWADASTLLAVYHEGIARYTDRGGGTWDVEYWPKDGTTGLSDEMTLTDVAPVPGTLDFYVSAFTFRGGTSETLVYFNNLDGEFHATALRSALGGPLDPAYAVVVDPVATANVYVGTVTGVWTATRADRTGGHGGAAGWTRLDNGLPWAAAQDLAVWVDPARVLPGAAGYDAAVDARTSRVLRVAMQSRGLFQLELGPAAPRHTWVRVHDADDRRVSPTPLAHPRQVDAARVPVVLPDLSSPDVVVRPRWPVATAPPFPSLGPGDPPLTAGTILPYDLWTFQTAFRWLHPSVVADGTFSTPFRAILKAHRGDGRAVIDRPLWETVVGGTHRGPGEH
ncbi:MAG: hypothetical protein IE926_19735, partial [Micrococcales bacterium]|nr:hypothetical protein [Micrococcales bacterium]